MIWQPYHHAWMGYKNIIAVHKIRPQLHAKDRGTLSTKITVDYKQKLGWGLIPTRIVLVTNLQFSWEEFQRHYRLPRLQLHPSQVHKTQCPHTSLSPSWVNDRRPGIESSADEIILLCAAHFKETTSAGCVRSTSFVHKNLFIICNSATTHWNEIGNNKVLNSCCGPTARDWTTLTDVSLFWKLFVQSSFHRTAVPASFKHFRQLNIANQCWNIKK